MNKTAKRAMAELREVAREIPREEARVLHSEAVDLVVKLEVRHGFRRKVRRVVDKHEKQIAIELK